MVFWIYWVKEIIKINFMFIFSMGLLENFKLHMWLILFLLDGAGLDNYLVFTKVQAVLPKPHS